MAISGKVVELDSKLVSFIDTWKGRPGSEIMILHKVQEVYGYVPREVAMEISREIGIPLAKIYGIITFYHLFKLKKPGKNQISVCMGTACYLKGGNDLITEIEQLLGVGVNSTSSDGLFSLELVRCVGCCGLAPVMVINGKTYGNLKKNMLPEIFAEYRNKEEGKANG
ncbi:MAG TPA: NAD(P)H-dependent oxidoreductase subunit E [Candidatus Goldiibacteriota bacterium]|nr:NAD(P)H-dependent oxidoreductase subunit E [Candidatus Goldiibacteriota bacterium]HPN65101.1 NAD(P)H-dependent oxidoreductase subunit E [Candidatus Goldiibacteriota bacterium]HRQ43156.1 NAD(P)H-dependent oxidoreductase subunit E [Candidatus Goldiibacteriota bacterium]